MGSEINFGLALNELVGGAKIKGRGDGRDHWTAARWLRRIARRNRCWTARIDSGWPLLNALVNTASGSVLGIDSQWGGWGLAIEHAAK